MKPSKACYKREGPCFKTDHIHQTLSMYKITELLRKAYLKAFIPEYIISGFMVDQIYARNRNLFKDYEFLLLYVYDRLLTKSSEVKNPPV
jgi:hypothetical protein